MTKRKPFVLGVIPARLQSSRLSRKLLLPIAGKPVLWHTFLKARRATALDDLIIATDSREIEQVAQEFGAKVIMTSKKHKTGSDRIAEAVRKFRGPVPDIVVNIQGDEPLVPPRLINALIRRLMKESKLAVVVAASSGISRHEIGETSFVKVAVNRMGEALFFTRALIPYHHVRLEKPPYCGIVGLIAFRRPFLFEYVKLPRGPLERVESVEQLRIIEHGFRCGVVTGKFDILGVNTYEEYKKVKKIIERSRS